MSRAPLRSRSINKIIPKAHRIHNIGKSIIKTVQVVRAKRGSSNHDQVVDENFSKIENRLQVEESCARVVRAKRGSSNHDQVVDESFSQIGISSLVEKSDTVGAFAAVQKGPNISSANFFVSIREDLSQEETKKVPQSVVNPSQEETKKVPQGVNPSHKEDQDSHKGRGLAPGG